MAEGVATDVPGLDELKIFAPEAVVREAELGPFNFQSAVPIVRGVVELFKSIPNEILPELPDQHLSALESQAKGCWETIQQMVRFNPTTANSPASQQQDLVAQLKARYSEAISQLAGVLAFASIRERSLPGAEAQARALLATAEDSSKKVSVAAENAEKILSEIRTVAGKAGVSKQSGIFGEQADNHAIAASKWQGYTVKIAVGLGVFAVSSWVLGFFVSPKDSYQAVQFAVSKVLIFSTIAFMLFLSARTLMAHRHNEVVNRHRQNALLTFNTLAEAATSEQTREVVLTHAAACIYAPQESGFSKSVSPQPNTSLIEILPRIAGGHHTSGASS